MPSGPDMPSGMDMQSGLDMPSVPETLPGLVEGEITSLIASPVTPPGEASFVGPLIAPGVMAPGTPMSAYGDVSARTDPDNVSDQGSSTESAD